MTEALFTAGEIFILIPETQAYSAAETTECFYIGDSRFSFCGMNSKPHDTAPFALLKLHRILRLFIGPEQSHRMILELNYFCYCTFHLVVKSSSFFLPYSNKEVPI